MNEIVTPKTLQLVHTNLPFLHLTWKKQSKTWLKESASVSLFSKPNPWDHDACAAINSKQFEGTDMGQRPFLLLQKSLLICLPNVKCISYFRLYKINNRIVWYHILFSSELWNSSYHLEHKHPPSCVPSCWCWWNCYIWVLGWIWIRNESADRMFNKSRVEPDTILRE